MCSTAAWALGNLIKPPNDGVISQYWENQIENGISWLLGSIPYPSTEEEFNSFIQQQHTAAAQPTNENSLQETEKDFLYESSGEGAWLAAYLTAPSLENISILLKIPVSQLESDKIVDVSSNFKNLVSGCVGLLTRGSVRDPLLSLPALRLLGNFICKSDAISEYLLNTPCFLTSVRLIVMNKQLQSSALPVVREALYLIANLSAGSHLHRIQLLNYQFLPIVFNFLVHGEFYCKKESAFTISNLICVEGVLDILLNNFNCVPVFIALLDYRDNQMLFQALFLIEYVLQYRPDVRFSFIFLFFAFFISISSS